MEARAEDLLPVEYFHVVFTLPAEIAQIAYWNKKAVYRLLFKASAEMVMTIAADPKRMGARVGMTSVLHTWGSALTHHPHIHMIVPGGGLLRDGTKWVACRPGFFLHVRVLSRLFRRLFLEDLMELHRAGHLVFFGDLAELADVDTFTAWLAPFRKTEWFVPAAVVPCASSRSSAVGRNRCCAPHRGSRPHDASPVIRNGTPPAAIRRPGPNSLGLSDFGAPHGGNHAATSSLVGIIERACARLRRHAHL